MKYLFCKPHLMAVWLVFFTTLIFAQSPNSTILFSDELDLPALEQLSLESIIDSFPKVEKDTISFRIVERNELGFLKIDTTKEVRSVGHFLNSAIWFWKYLNETDRSNKTKVADLENNIEHSLLYLQQSLQHLQAPKRLLTQIVKLKDNFESTDDTVAPFAETKRQIDALKQSTIHFLKVGNYDMCHFYCAMLLVDGAQMNTLFKFYAAIDRTKLSNLCKKRSLGAFQNTSFACSFDKDFIATIQKKIDLIEKIRDVSNQHLHIKAVYDTVFVKSGISLAALH